jgi:hypothetical protein
MQAAIMMNLQGPAPPAPAGAAKLNPRSLGTKEMLNPRTLLDLALLVLAFALGGGA